VHTGDSLTGHQPGTFLKWNFYAGINVVSSLPCSLISHINKKEQFKVAIKIMTLFIVLINF
jgi:hypothetical protein